jgi:hypothetical protein
MICQGIGSPWPLLAWRDQMASRGRFTLDPQPAPGFEGVWEAENSLGRRGTTPSSRWLMNGEGVL